MVLFIMERDHVISKYAPAKMFRDEFQQGAVRIQTINDEIMAEIMQYVETIEKINGKKLKKGDSFFVPANFGKYEISGECEIIVTNI